MIQKVIAELETMWSLVSRTTTPNGAVEVYTMNDDMCIVIKPAPGVTMHGQNSPDSKGNDRGIIFVTRDL